ncbi:DUF3160 domain-containing protein [candidate division WOR-3 bacterium]|nr:DUF3160 domain-containing protein [candidate division WOR-3 bacterium]
MISLFIFISILSISSQIEEKLKTQDFVILPTKEKNIYDIYEGCKKSGEPILVTQDVVLHTTHILFDYTLRVLEIEDLLPNLETLTIRMLEASISQAKDARDKVIKEALFDNIGFFGVAAKLLCRGQASALLDAINKIPETIRQKIGNELKLIEAHQGITPSPIFGYYEDYTQYIPRGHYTRNKDFERYFKAMMWYGRIGFYLRPNPTMYPDKIDPIKEGIRLTRRAILITKIITSAPDLTELWDEIYKPTTFFVGKAEDFTIQDYAPLIKGINPSLNSLVLSFIEKACQLPKPKIISTPTADTLGLMGFRFMGQRFIPDSYIFQNLVYPYVKKYTGKSHPFTLENTILGPLRCFPRGLDVMYVFGSEAAGDILKEEGDTDYEDYFKQVKKLKEEFAGLPQTQWNENLYWRWLCALKSLITHTHQNYPKFMQSRDWLLKELNTALGSWAELRHDTILYAKQSYTMVTLAAPRPIELTKGFVEPYPEIYNQLSELIKELLKVSEYPTEVKNKLTDFSKLLVKLSDISTKELELQELSNEDYNLIWNIGATLKSLTYFSPELMSKITSGTDEEMAIIADVHTDPNSQKVLEEAVGYPSIIYVKLSNSRIVKGAIFSYYEFKSPMASRLTDEQWQAKLKEKPPELQSWFLPLLK